MPAHRPAKSWPRDTEMNIVNAFNKTKEQFSERVICIRNVEPLCQQKRYTAQIMEPRQEKTGLRGFRPSVFAVTEEG